MADDLDFDSFDNLDDLDWSELEKDVKENAPGTAAAPAKGKPAGDAPQAAASAAGLSGEEKRIEIDYLLDVNLQVTVEVGRRMYYISEVLGWDHGSIIELDKLVGEPLNLLINNKPVAKGEVVVINDKFALKIIDILDPHDRLNYLHT
jgi:flagellar motor switch protein FliN/FliY